MSVSSSRRSVPIAGKLPCIVCCTSTAKEWQLQLQKLDDKPRQWYFCNAEPITFLERSIHRPNVALIRASWQALQLVKRNQADLLVTNHPAITFWCALFATLQSTKVNHLAVSFYLPKLPRGIWGVLTQLVYSSVPKLIVHSRAERQLYSEHFGIPMARFEMQHWGQEIPQVQPVEPLQSGEYICAISDQPQDYQTLIAAIATLPHIPLILVIPKGQKVAANVPPNVTILTGLSTANRMNILQYSRFLVLPIRQSDTPCDYRILVAAMQFSKAIVISDFPSVSDYAFHNANAAVFQSADPGSLARTVQDLWKNVVKCEILGANGKEFAHAFCSQTATFERFQQLLFRRGL